MSSGAVYNITDAAHIDLPDVSRVEIIDHREQPRFEYPRTVVASPDRQTEESEGKPKINVFVEIQDEGRTLKVFLEDRR